MMKLLTMLTKGINKVYLIYRYLNKPLLFEYDETKSKTNLAKHGIDFITAQQLWDDDNAIDSSLNTKHEPRFLHIGMLSGKFYSAVFTWRGDKIRLISVRRARSSEVQKYEKHSGRGTGQEI